MEDKIVCLGFLNYNIDINLFFRTQKFSKIKIIYFLFMKTSFKKKYYFFKLISNILLVNV